MKFEAYGDKWAGTIEFYLFPEEDKGFYAVADGLTVKQAEEMRKALKKAIKDAKAS